MSRRHVIAATAAIAALTLSACGSSSDGAAEAPADGTTTSENRTFVYVSDIEPTSYDTGSFRNLSNYNIAAQILDPLVAQAPDGSYHPALAASWTTSDDLLTWTFTLRDDVVFHDGEPLTAQAVDVSVLRAIELRPVAWYESSRAVDELTWELTLTQPYAPLLQNLSNPNLPILSLASQEEYTDADRATDPRTIVGTGPFVVTEITPGSGLTLTRNEDYNWAPDFREHQGPAYLETVEVRFIPESQSRVGTLSSGQADAAAAIPPADLDSVLEGDGFAYASAPTAGIPFTAVLNTAATPTADERVRKALQQGIDVQTIVDTVYSGRYARAWTALTPVTAPSGSYNAELEDSYAYDPAEAARLLDEAGWTGLDSDGYRTQDGERLSLDWIVDTSDIRDQRDVVIEAFQAEARTLGIEITIENLDSSTYGDRGGAGEYSIVAESWSQSDAWVYALQLDPSAVPPNGLNYSRTTSEELGGLVQQAVSSGDDEERASIYRDLQEVQVEQAHNIPIYIQDFIVATTDAVEGISFNPTGWPDAFYDVRFVK